MRRHPEPAWRRWEPDRSQGSDVRIEQARSQKRAKRSGGLEGKVSQRKERESWCRPTREDNESTVVRRNEERLEARDDATKVVLVARATLKFGEVLVTVGSTKIVDEAPNNGCGGEEDRSTERQELR